MNNKLNVLNNENKEICSSCGGKCCKNMSGMYWPEDFGTTIELMKNKIISMIEKLSIDCWEGDPRENKNELSSVYFLRPRHRGESFIDYSWGGTCVNLTDTGCMLQYQDRPTQCRMLEPIQSHHCQLPKKYAKQNGAIMWIPYQSLLEEIMNHDHL